MRKIISILLLFIFITFSFGVAITRHYCGGKFAYTKVDTSLAHTSCCDDEEMPADCCKNETQVYKVEDDYKASQKSPGVAPVVIGFIQSFALYFNSEDNSFVEPEYRDHSPPFIIEDFASMFQSFLF